MPDEGPIPLPLRWPAALAPPPPSQSTARGGRALIGGPLGLPSGVAALHGLFSARARLGGNDLPGNVFDAVVIACCLCSRWPALRSHV